MRTTAFALLALAASVPAGAARQSPAGATFTVATNGNDGWSGTLPAPNRAKNDGPFATLERARDAVRSLKKAGPLPTGGVTIQVRGGVYSLERALELQKEDSGTAEAPVVYRAYGREEVRLGGGKVLAGWQAVSDPAVLQRLDVPARDKVLQTDLRAQGITDFGQPSGGWGQPLGTGLELFYNDRPMTIARWPNEGFVKIADVLNEQPFDVRGTKGDKAPKFVYEGDRVQRWLGEKDLWLHGYWFWDWAEGRQKVVSIDTEKRVITMAPPVHTFGYRKGQWYYAYNALCELDQPGEWYLDRESGILYFWPPSSGEKGGTGEGVKGRRGRAGASNTPALQHSSTPVAQVSVLRNLITMKDASYVTVRGMTLETSRNTAVTISGGTGTRVAGCVVRNTGAYAVSIAGGSENGVVGCDIYDTAAGGIILSGGDRRTLTPARHYAENNHIHHYARFNRILHPGVSIDGVGNRVAHNLIDNAPHMAIQFGGNEHVIEYNEIHSVCFESNDAGAMYAGYNWTTRGHQIRHNYLHHINGFEGRGCVGVYLDDMFSSANIVGNIFYQVTRAAFIGGGRDNLVENNLFVDCRPALHVDARCMGWASASVVPGGPLQKRLEEIPYREEPWKSRYPQLLTVWEDEPAAPKGNVIARNICWGGKWDEVEGKAKPYQTFRDNLVGEDPLFVNAAKGDFRLKKDSPAWKIGFQPIPVEKIGIQKDDLRASWPVQHEVRPMVLPPAAPSVKRAGPPPVFRVSRAPAPVAVDGTIVSAEWAGADPAKAMLAEQGLDGAKVSQPSRAWFSWDDKALYVAVDNTVSATKPLRPGNQWGSDDAVELAFRDPSTGSTPILVLRGYPSGHFDSSDEAGAPPAAVKQAAQGVEYKSKILGPGRWTTEWRIPFASLGIDPAKTAKIAFSLSVRKPADDLWVQWVGTRDAATWQVAAAGFLELAR